MSQGLLDLDGIDNHSEHKYDDYIYIINGDKRYCIPFNDMSDMIKPEFRDVKVIFTTFALALRDPVEGDRAPFTDVEEFLIKILMSKLTEQQLGKFLFTP